MHDICVICRYAYYDGMRLLWNCIAVFLLGGVSDAGDGSKLGFTWLAIGTPVLHLPYYTIIYGTALGTPTPPPRGWSWFPAPPPVGVGGVVVDGWQCWLMES